MSSKVWRNCSVCKSSINQGSIYQKCSVSSCRKHVFCSVKCWDVHSGVMGHRSAWAEEERAPHHAFDETPKKRIVVGSSSSSGPQASKPSGELPQDVLIVISKLKNYVKARSDYNTSGDVADKLSDYVRALVDDAINEARAEGRKTVMARDFKTKF